MEECNELGTKEEEMLVVTTDVKMLLVDFETETEVGTGTDELTGWDTELKIVDADWDLSIEYDDVHGGDNEVVRLNMDGCDDIDKLLLRTESETDCEDSCDELAFSELWMACDWVGKKWLLWPTLEITGVWEGLRVTFCTLDVNKADDCVTAIDDKRLVWCVITNIVLDERKDKDGNMDNLGVDEAGKAVPFRDMAELIYDEFRIAIETVADADWVDIVILT